MNYYGTSDLGLNLPHFELFRLYLQMIDQNLYFYAKSFNFDQTYLNEGSKTQNVEELSLDLLYQNHFW